MQTTGVSIRSKPKVGEIHTVRISIASLFGSESNFDSAPENRSQSSSASASASASSSGKKFDDRPRKRPCVIWKTTPIIQVLVMSRFDGVNVTDSNICLFNHLTHEYVLKRLLAVSPKAPYGGRRSISAVTNATNASIKTVDTNLILIPAVVPEKWQCKTVQEYFPPEELLYVYEIIRQIDIEESEELMKSIQAINYPRAPPPYNDNIINQDENSSSLTSSSLPKPRIEFVEDMHWKKSDFIKEWLDHVQIEIADYPQSSNNSLDDFQVDIQSTVSLFDHV